MGELNRGEIVALLEQLGAADDQAVLSAARSLTSRLAEVGLTWDQLLRSKLSPDADDASAGPARTVIDRSDDARLIEQLLAKKGLSKELRDSLTEIKRDLDDGVADIADLRYVRALAKRLGV